MQLKSLLLVTGLSMFVFSACNGQKKMDKNATMKTQIDTVSYSLGVNIGSNLKSQGFGDINVAAMMKAMEDVLGDKTLSINEDDANMHIPDLLSIDDGQKSGRRQSQRACIPRRKREKRRYHHNCQRFAIPSAQNG
jgi:hypothetical protein